MRPGEVQTGSAPSPAADAARRATIGVTNTGRTTAYIGSHFPLARASEALSFDRAGLEGARLDLPAGATVRIPPGETVELAIMWDA